MTIWNIIACAAAIIIAIIVIIAAMNWNRASGYIKFITIIASILVAAIVIGGICWWSFGTEAGKRAYKDQQSNIAGGLERIIQVFDVNGDLIKEYSGKFDIEADAGTNYILFDDEYGKRHMIFYTTGTVTIDEP